MKKIAYKLFLDYISEHNISKDEEYLILCKKAVEAENELRKTFSNEQTRLFENLFELNTQIHYSEVKNAFEGACKLFIEE